MPFGDCISIVVYGGYLMRLCVTRRRVGQRYWPWGLCMVAVTVSPLIAFVAGRDSEALLFVVRQTMHYLFIVVLYVEIGTLRQYATLLKAYLLVALVSSAALHLYHSFPYLANPEITDASFRGLVAGDPRIFTSGMGYVCFAAVGLMVLLSDARPRTLLIVVATEAFLLSGLVWTYVRSFFVVLAVCLAVHLALSVFTRRTSRRFAVLMCSVAVLCGVALQFSSSLDSLKVRLGGLERMATSYEENTGTVAWRVDEASAAVASMQGPLEAAFGTFAGRFGLREYVGFSVHIGWIGVYYHYGVFGVAAFAVMFISLVRRLCRQYSTYRNSGDRFLRLLVKAHLLLLIAFTMIAFGGGSFASSGSIIMLAILWHGAALLEVQRMRACSALPSRMPEWDAIRCRIRLELLTAVRERGLSQSPEELSVLGVDLRSSPA